MTEVKHPSSVENLAIIASWLEQPGHFQNRRHGLKDFTNTKSFQCVTAMKEVLNSDTDNSYRIKTGNRRESDSTSENTGQSDVFSKRPPESALPRDLRHPGVLTLLDEYYKLMDHSSSQKRQSVGNTYRPSFKTHMWRLATALLPSTLQLSTVISSSQSFLERLAPERRIPIIAFLVIWLCLFKILLLINAVHPIILVLVACIGVYILILSEGKLQASVKQQLQTKRVLKEFEVAENSALLKFSHASVYAGCLGHAKHP